MDIILKLLKYFLKVFIILQAAADGYIVSYIGNNQYEFYKKLY